MLPSEAFNSFNRFQESFSNQVFSILNPPYTIAYISIKPGKVIIIQAFECLWIFLSYQYQLFFLVGIHKDVFAFNCAKCFLCI